MKLTVVFPVMNQHLLAKTAISHALQNLSEKHEVQLLVMDNGSDEPFHFYSYDKIIPTIVRREKNTGVYPLFWDALKYAAGDIVAFFHSDLIIAEEGWDERVIQTFEQMPRLGLLGFIGSNEIDAAGGRGLGTTSNFQGGTYTESDGNGGYQTWHGSPAVAHGRMESGFSNAAVVDGCAMIFRKELLSQIGQRESFPPHHFYDRLLSCEVREWGYQVGVLGVACDHISGQTVNQEKKYDDMAQEWAVDHGLFKEIDDSFLGTVGLPDGCHNWDSVLYKEAERQWLNEYRDTKHFIPCRV